MTPAGGGATRGPRPEGWHHVATYTLVYRDDDGENEVTETLENVDDVQREDGIVSLWRGDEAFLRLQERHVVSLVEV